MGAKRAPRQVKGQHERTGTNQIGIGAHSDYASLTGDVRVNIGEQMARWTNDLFGSTLHRTINLTGRLSKAD